MVERGMKVDTRCQRCGLEGESSNHVLFTCSVARQVWALSLFPSPPSGFDMASVFENLFFVLTTSKKLGFSSEIARTFPWLLWMLWKNRNKLIFEGL